MLAALRPHPSLWQLIATGCRRHAFSISGSLSHRRTYILLHTTYNPSLDCPTLPQLVTSLAKPPKSIVLLATSRYATFLANDIGVLESHIATLFNPMSTMSSASLSPSDKPGIEVLAGVVDALPVLSTQEGNGIKARRQEGYTWLITDKAGIITTPWKENKSKDIDEFGAPIMRVSGRRTNWGNERPIPFIFTFPIRSAESVGACRAVVTLPLSNTLFQTGTLATVVRFNVGGWGDRLSPQPVLAENRLYRVEVPVMSLEGGRARSGRRLPLLPLTEPREVIACAGNILRGLKISEGGTTPASRELEVAVGRYFRDRGRRQEKVDVFAYITPQKPSGENGGEVDPWDTQKGKLRRMH
ncbi:hypothetical protein BDZ91DRAFT_196360 [Kalaharituber pfeilii]|nr:hypothetical protein BDZ91DRAFT_196360 [Kalaharituber pfeilii]